MTAIRGPIGSIRERQVSQVSDVQGGSMGGRSLTLGNISESDFNGNDESFRGFSNLNYHVTAMQSDCNSPLPGRVYSSLLFSLNQ